MKKIDLSNLLSEIGRNLHTIRNARKETLQAVATTIGVTHPVLSKIENGRYEGLQLSLVVQLCNHYGVSLQQILSLETATIFQLTQHNAEGAQRLVGQELSQGYELYKEQVEKEISYLRQQNQRLLDIISKKAK